MNESLELHSDRSPSPPTTKPKDAWGMGPSLKPARPAGATLSLQYFFSLSCNLTSTEPPPIEVPGGVRVHLGYVAENSEITTNDQLFQQSWGQAPNPRLADVTERDRKQVEDKLVKSPRVGITKLLNDLAQKYGDQLRQQKLEWPGLSGKVLSGGDTMLVRSDGVVIFDGRATIEEDRGFLIDVCASGVVDLRDALPGRSGQETFEAYCGGEASSAPTTGIPIKLSIRFEASQGAGTAGEFAAKRYVLNSLNHWKFESLVRGQFVGIGKLHVKADRYWPAHQIELDVYRLGS